MSNSRFSRQSFLGGVSQSTFERAIIGIVGLGGGGSHIVQQLAHIGFLRYVIYDPDVIEDSNLNRLIGATEEASMEHRLKVEVAARLIRGLRPAAVIEAYTKRWQEKPEPIRGCDIIFGCVDSFAERRELEACARRYLIPYIDIGMDIHCVGDEPPRMGGQVILSMPGGPCMFCLGFLTDDALAKEAARYGHVGDRAQVVWPNGVLASTAVGVAIDLLTDWTRSMRDIVFLLYDGNAGTVMPHPRLQFLNDRRCPHYSLGDVGDSLFKSL